MPLDNPEDRFSLQALLDQSRHAPEARAVHFALLKSMRMAVYSALEDTHYALATNQYCHFTSPIRRYPDLVVHRQLSRLLKQGRAPADVQELDVLARRALWMAGLDFDHGTGHGVGAYLSVHEGPARINKSDRTALEPGMILSNEPGYYKQGEYGIRIENLVLVEERQIAGAEGRYFGFETLTFAPIDKNLVDVGLLNTDELRWWNDYHIKVLDIVGPQLEGDALAWATEACAELERG